MKENLEKATTDTSDRTQQRVIFTEDLKNTTYLVENNQEQLDLLSAMIRA